MVTEKWPDSGYILEVEPEDIDDCLGVSEVRMKEVNLRDDSSQFNLSK